MWKNRLFSRFSIFIILSLLIACAPAAQKPTITPTPNLTDPIQVWLDTSRQTAAMDFASTYPEKGPLVRLNVVDEDALLANLPNLSQDGSGWPDASFTGQQAMPMIIQDEHKYPGDLKSFVAKEIIDGFTPGSLAECWDGEKLYCLRNDLGFFVFWYNATKVKELGVSLPATYEEMMDVCKQVKQKNPAVQCVLGHTAFNFVGLLVSNQCPFQQILGAGKIRINAVHENCVKAARYLDEMASQGYYLITDLGASTTVDLVRSDNWLFMPVASWFADYAIRGYYYAEDDPKFVGKIGVAPMPKWEGQDHAWVYWTGGGTWVMSSRAKNPQLAADFLVYMSTEAIKEQGTYPAYLPAAEAWRKNRLPTMTYLEDPVKAGEIMQQEATHMWTMAAEGPVDIYGVWNVIQPRIDSGELTYEQALVEFQKGLVAAAEKMGYQPETSGFDDFK